MHQINVIECSYDLIVLSDYLIYPFSAKYFPTKMFMQLFSHFSYLFITFRLITAISSNHIGNVRYKLNPYWQVQ